MVDPLTADLPRRDPDAEEATSAATDLTSLAADSRTVAGWTLVSRVTGFGRVVTVAAVLGPTYFGNLFQTTGAAPVVVHELLVGSLISAMLVPALVRHVDLRDRAAASRLAGGFLGTAIIAASAVVALCILAAPLLLAVMTAAVDDAEIKAQQHQLGWPLLIMLMPQIFLYGVAATGVAVQQAHGRFALAAAAPALENIGTMVVMGASALLFGLGLDVDEITTSQLILLGLGSTSAVALHAAAQWWGAHRLGVSLRPRAGWRDPEVRQVIRLAIPSSGYAALNSLVFFGLLIVAGALPGGAVAFQIGYDFFNLPVALCARPVAAAQLPRLSRSIQRGTLAEFHATYRGSLALAAFIALPASLLFACIPHTLAQGVSFGEMATVSGRSMVAAAIGGLAVGIVGETAFLVATSASYARRDATAPFRGMAIRAALAVIGMAIAVSAMHGEAILWTLGLSLSGANLIAAAYLHRSQVRRLPLLPAGKLDRFLGDVVASVIAAFVGLVVALWLADVTQDHYRSIGTCVAVLGASGLSYLCIQWARGSAELNSLLSGILKAGPESVTLSSVDATTGRGAPPG
jgi:putative peptidoglycan lipid II flippase